MRSANLSVLQQAIGAVNAFRDSIDAQSGIKIDSLSIKLDGGGMIVLTWLEEAGDWQVVVN